MMYASSISLLHLSSSLKHIHKIIKLTSIPMKALKTEKSKQYFKKYEKPTQTQDALMDRLEAAKIANVVGIDLGQMKNVAWFFQLVAKLKLPQDYVRFLSESRDEVIYFSKKTHEQSTSHPSLLILKTLFYESLANNKAVYTFLDKESKLLPFVEQRMLRQCIGIGSKRRDAQKVNLQRDQNGKMVMSKLERIKPDIKGLLSSRSYMLKMIVEKVFTRKEIIGRGKRAVAYANTIAEVKKQMKLSMPEKDQEILEQEEDLELYQRVFQQAAYYYQYDFGDIEKIPMSVLKSKQYIQSTPQNVLKNIFLLSIQKDSIQLYWLARMMDCLPLPPNWSKKKGSSFDSYFYEPQKLLFDIHPSYIYILNQINKFKFIFEHLDSIRKNYYYNMRQLTFYDFFERSYTVDMYGYIEINAKKTKSRERERKHLKNQQGSDWMVLEGMRNSPITPYCYHLTECIQRYWNSLNFVSEPWCPSISPFGQVVWSSNINMKSMSFNPYKPILTKIVSAQMAKLPQITNDILKKQYQTKPQNEEESLQRTETLKSNEYLPTFLDTEALIQERQQFLTYYLEHQDKALPWPYELKNKFQLIDQKDYFDQIFISPFQLDKDLVAEDGEVPFWLQKCRAKQYSIDNINMLLFNPQSFSETKEKIANYALQMYGDHEPYLLEQIQKKINRISNPEELVKFLNHINDLDLREQRKKQYRESLLQLESDSDIFGSEISQVDVQEVAQQEEEEHEEKVEESSESIEGKESVKEPSESQEEASELEPVQEVKIEEEKLPEPPREEYEFIKAFPKKQYKKSWALELKTQEQLTQTLRDGSNMKRRKCKYKQGLIRQKIGKEIQNYNKLKHLTINQLSQLKQSTVIKAKRNLAITKFRHALGPYRTDDPLDLFKIAQNIQRKQQSQMNYSEITDYQDFRSQITAYEIGDIQQLIAQQKQKKLIKTKLRTQSVHQPQIEHEVTQDTIELEPIYQIKPDIQQDPLLKSINGFAGDLSHFRKTFNQKAATKYSEPKYIEQEEQEKEQIKKKTVVTKSKSLRNIRMSESNYQSVPVKSKRSSSQAKINSLHVESRLSLTKRESVGGIPKTDPQHKPFHRVCLEHTASHFLGKQAFLRKGDIVTMEARKILLSKGRGLQTYISKFY